MARQTTNEKAHVQGLLKEGRLRPSKRSKRPGAARTSRSGNGKKIK
jgi:hypothetical protein|tara:strand:+ start:886 stop:1023 length:138 start_codon:yes stop_codon:yes gene_type:complete